MTGSRAARAPHSPRPATPPVTGAAPELARLPGRLQACFVVESETFSWWGVEDPAAAASRVGLLTGTPGPLRVALPDLLSGRVLAATVPATHVAAADAVPALAELSGRAPGAGGDSLRLWAHIAAHLRANAAVVDDELTGLAGRLPTAGHAALAMDGVTIWSATATVDAARQAFATRAAGSAGGVESLLRPYQRAGAGWLRAAETHGGALLADEMGLGKTLQAIAVFASRRTLPHLVVCPTSLISNWARELTKFAPHVPVLVYAGGRRTDTLSEVAPGTVVVTSYGVLRSTASGLASKEWDVVVLDEAQQIKNPDALAARAARTLDARLRVAMTGTPVENRLDELWSLLAFTNPGLLGTRARFRRRFAVSIEQRGSTAAATRLHEIVAPHILRRLKRDVAPELPDKIEATVVCRLTDEQQRLYRTCLDDCFDGGLGSGIGRRGRILALLTQLKRICNHPEHVAPTGDELGGRSGKLDRATEILAEVVDAGDRALVFTQYRDTGALLSRHLTENVTGPAAAVPFLHGGLSLHRRDGMVEYFQNDPGSPPILVLSLRAGRRLAEPTTVLRPNPALPRARALVLHDQVHDLRMATGTITATVGGRTARHVSIVLTTWTGAQQRRATARLADHTATDDLPDTAHAALRTSGLALAPDPATTTSQCDCSAPTQPCVHILAVYYETARRLDERPRLALALRHADTARVDKPNSRTPLTRIEPTGFYDSQGPLAFSRSVCATASRRRREAGPPAHSAACASAGVRQPKTRWGRP